jgi:polyketide biosynthesis acyl carrier protein
MNKEEIFAVIKQQIRIVLPSLPLEQVAIEQSLRELGANSIDRMEIVVLSMEKLGIVASPVEMGNIKNLQGLVDYFFARKNAG